MSAELLVARELTTGIHQVDSPAFDALGRLYLTQSGSRGTRVPVPIFRISADGVREPLSVDIANPTSMTLGPDRAMYISSRFDGHVYRLDSDDTAELYATELGVATGLAFGSDGSLFVGDRLGIDHAGVAGSPGASRLRRCRRASPRSTWRSVRTSVSTSLRRRLSSHDPIYRISPDRLVDVVCDGFGRPQGLAFDAAGMLYVVDALAGASGVYRVDVTAPRPVPELRGRRGVAGRRRVRSARPDGAGVERHGVELDVILTPGCHGPGGWMNLFRTKSLDAIMRDTEQEGTALKRVLGAGDLIMLAIGAVIGAGIFSSIGTAAAGEVLPSGEVVRYGAGPALILSFILLGGVCALAGLCYAELASMIPQAGSAYAYSYATLGEFIAWIIGWDLILEYAIGNIAVAIAWSGYFVSMMSGFGVAFPD